MSNVFNSVKPLGIRRNAFSSHSYVNHYTCNIGQVVPIYLQHVLPNTNIAVGTSALVRFQALIAPIMDNVDYYVHFWKVPYRLVDPDFVKWIGGELSDEDYDCAYIVPTNFYEDLIDRLRSLGWDLITATVNAKKICGDGSLLDMLGYDKLIFYDGKGTHLNRLNIRPILVYFKIVHDWYINEKVAPWETFDEDYEDLMEATGYVGFELAGFLAKLYKHCGLFFNHGWRKDYFTSALPDVQQGEPVQLSFSGSAPVTLPSGQQFSMVTRRGAENGLDWVLEDNGGSDNNVDMNMRRKQAPENNFFFEYAQGSERLYRTTGLGGQTASSLTGTADLSQASALTINELRLAVALQSYRERLMRAGTRAQEYYLSFWNVEPKDLRLQLPEFLGGGKMPILVSDIEQTSATSTTPQGNLAGKGTGLEGGFAGFRTFCDEESILIGLAWLQPKPSYARGLSRFLTKVKDRYDYACVMFQHLGEQAIESYELYSDATDGTIFGYTPRYNEYRFHPSEVHGEFKSTLAFWNLSRIFTKAPTLSPEFIYMHPNNFKRIFAVQNDPETGQPVPNVLASVKFAVRLVQPLSKYGVPMLIG